MNKTFTILVVASIVIFSSAANATPRHDKHGYDGRHHKYQHHNNQHRHKYQHHHKHHSKHRDYHAGYFLGGLFIGSMLADQYHQDSHYIRRKHKYYSGPVYYRNEYGSCFRVERRRHRDVLIEVPRGKCTAWGSYR